MNLYAVKSQVFELQVCIFFPVMRLRGWCICDTKKIIYSICAATIKLNSYLLLQITGMGKWKKIYACPNFPIAGHQDCPTRAS